MDVDTDRDVTDANTSEEALEDIRRPSSAEK
jgi:hypothetical protein